MNATVQIFLSYAREDEEKVKNLYQKLSDAGFKPWMDKKDILPGERWESSIRRAVRRSDFFLACLSANSVNKRGWIQREIKDALDMWQEKLEDDIYLIPVRLEDCEAPESLGGFQWVDLFEEDGWTRLVKAIQVGMERRGEVIKPIAKESTPFESYPAHKKPAPDTETTAPEEGPERVPDVKQPSRQFQPVNFKDLYEFARSVGGLGKSTMKATEWAEAWMKRFAGKDFGTFKEAYQFAYSADGLNMSTTKAVKWAEIWMERFADKDFGTFKEAFQFAYSADGLGMSKAKAVKWAIESLSKG